MKCQSTVVVDYLKAKLCLDLRARVGGEVMPLSSSVLMSGLLDILTFAKQSPNQLLLVGDRTRGLQDIIVLISSIILRLRFYFYAFLEAAKEFLWEDNGNL